MVRTLLCSYGACGYKSHPFIVGLVNYCRRRDSKRTARQHAARAAGAGLFRSRSIKVTSAADKNRFFKMGGALKSLARGARGGTGSILQR